MGRHLNEASHPLWLAFVYRHQLGGNSAIGQNCRVQRLSTAGAHFLADVHKRCGFGSGQYDPPSTFADQSAGASILSGDCLDRDGYPKCSLLQSLYGSAGGDHVLAFIPHSHDRISNCFDAGPRSVQFQTHGRSVFGAICGFVDCWRA